MSARLTRAERAELAAAWPDFGQVLATIERILTDRLTGVESERDEQREHKDRYHEQWMLTEAELADLRAAVEALADETDALAKTLTPCTGSNCAGCRLGVKAARLRALLAQQGGE